MFYDTHHNTNEEKRANCYCVAFSLGVGGICLAVGKEWDDYMALFVNDFSKCMSFIKPHQAWYKFTYSKSAHNNSLKQFSYFRIIRKWQNFKM